ncbi:MAG: ABC transporter ATP-binding protein [Deltaproteobacteria bacterium]|nr:ABC transporter ATP-binding protein [Deltaproteobacteria bacterium]
MSQSIADFENVEKSYLGKAALGPLSFRLSPGQVTVFLGPNGAGKSTTFKILLGLREPTKGIARLFGHSPRSPEARLRVGYTSQDLSYPAHLNTSEVLSLVKGHFRNTFDLEELKRRFNLERVWKNKLGGLSGGERRRVGLACALIGRPELLILDEPTTGLDVESRKQLWQEIERFKKQGGSVLLATHDLHEAGLIADRVLLLEKGQLRIDGTIEEILKPIDFKRLRYHANGKIFEESVKDSDAKIRDLVNQGTHFENLEVRRLGLEEALEIHSGQWK